MLKLHLLILHLATVAFSVLNSVLFEGIVVTSVVVQFLIEIVDDFVACYIQKLPCMRHDDHCASTIADVVLQPHDCVQI